MEKINKTQIQDFNLIATELRLGLPGSESPESRNTVNCTTGGGGGDDGGGGGGGGLMKKRGFSDTININFEKWGFSENGVFLGENKNPNFVKDSVGLSSIKNSDSIGQDSFAASSKAQVVGWPPIRSFRKNSMVAKNTKNEDDPNGENGSGCVYVKVSMDGAPYLRKVDLKIYASYLDLSSALEKMFSSFTFGQTGDGSNEFRSMDLLNGSEYVLTYEDKDGDLMLVGDVPWDMFTGSCKRMRIMKSSDAIGLAPRAHGEVRKA